MNKKIALPIVIVVLAAIVLGVFFLGKDEEQVPPPVASEPPLPDPPPVEPLPVETEDSGAESAEEPTVAESIDEEVFEPLPALDDSDPFIEEQVKQLAEQDLVSKLFSFRSFIRRFVVIIDNLPREKVPQRQVFTRPVPGKFSVIEADEQDDFFLDDKNFARYRHFVSLAERVSVDALALLYARYYPLFQQAYEELGYPDASFNERLIEVIDHVLAAPEVKQPIPLKRPHVFYLFADEKLERLSAGRKIMLRIGPENASRVRASLVELRSALNAVALPDRQ